MRILLLSTYFRPDVASTGVIMSTLADEFLARGHEVSVLTSVPHYGVDRIWPEYSGRLLHTERSGSLRIHRLYTHVAKDRANVFSRILSYGSFSLLSAGKGAVLPKHDVILAPSPPLSNGVIADMLGRWRGVPFVYNVQDIWPDVAVRAGVLKNEKTIRRLKKMEAYVYRRASGITVISEGFRRNLLEKGVPDEKITVIPNFIDSSFVVPQPKNNEFSRRHGVAGKFVVMFAGNMGFSQGLETVLDAAKLLAGVPEIEFLMVGNGAGRSSAEEYLKTLDIGNARFLPFQPHDELPAMYGASDVCVIPLRRGFTIESVPCKLFTIMAAGRPAIAAVDPGSDTWQLLQRSGCGMCVEPENARALADAILHYFQNAGDRTAAGRNARRCTEVEFNPGTLAEAYLEAMRRAIGLGTGRTSMAVTSQLKHSADD
jgi:colanic acid biosynthesis glycosyl transferase WcaI